MDYVKEFNIGRTRCFVRAITDDKHPYLNRIHILFGPVDVGIWDEDERKALISALLEADAVLDDARKDDVA